MRLYVRFLFLGVCLFFAQAICEDASKNSPAYVSQFGEHLLEQIATKAHGKISSIELLGGFTNKNYLFTFKDNTSYVIKIFNIKLGDYSQRKQESANQNKASKINLAPKIELIDDRTCMIEYIPSIKPFEIDEKSLPEYAKLIAQLHYSNLQFEGQFNFVNLIENYLNICIKENRLSKSEEIFSREVSKKFELLSQKLSIPLNVPCHNDLHPLNFLTGKEGIKLVDWEDSSMNDPAWDLSYFLISSFVPENLWSRFFEIYQPLMPKEDPLLIKRVKLYRPFVLLKMGLLLKCLIDVGTTTKELETINDLVALCMDNAKAIFYKDTYQTFLNSMINNTS